MNKKNGKAQPNITKHPKIWTRSGKRKTRVGSDPDLNKQNKNLVKWTLEQNLYSLVHFFLNKQLQREKKTTTLMLKWLQHPPSQSVSLVSHSLFSPSSTKSNLNPKKSLGKPNTSQDVSRKCMWTETRANEKINP